ncbi:hypothetical protein MUK42_35557 [Musa troglodytarum]|uniref:Uncharacterized protein n=1 Tax=Musa troglodytarum TaxID=320322 RepID=A0A9E7GNY8_9LILI|nr:hypothetical protein MUK42_35557 [Musa troglodytarum]
MESEDRVAERTVIRGSDSPRGWPALRNNCSPTTVGGPHDCVVVCHQAPGVGCDNGKGLLCDAPTTCHGLSWFCLSRAAPMRITAKVSLPKISQNPLGPTEERTGQRKRFTRDPQATLLANTL